MRKLRAGLIVVAAVALLPFPAAVAASDTPDPSSVTIAGSLQAEAGCPDDWQPACAATHLAYDANDDVWQGAFSLPAGSYDYKAALNDDWAENYGLHAVSNGPNIPPLASAANVKFYYDHKSHWATDNRSSVIATAVGSFQAELGCSGDWDPRCLRSWLQDLDGDGTYTFETTALPHGSYEGRSRSTRTGPRTTARAASRAAPNIAFRVPADNTKVTFSYDSVHARPVDHGRGRPRRAGRSRCLVAFRPGAKGLPRHRAEPTSKVWYTVAGGVLSDVYYPTVDNTNLETLQYIVTDGSTFTDLQARDMTYAVEPRSRTRAGWPAG